MKTKVIKSPRDIRTQDLHIPCGRRTQYRLSDTSGIGTIYLGRILLWTESCNVSRWGGVCLVTLFMSVPEHDGPRI